MNFSVPKPKAIEPLRGAIATARSFDMPSDDDHDCERWRLETLSLLQHLSGKPLLGTGGSLGSRSGRHLRVPIEDRQHAMDGGLTDAIAGLEACVTEVLNFWPEPDGASKPDTSPLESCCGFATASLCSTPACEAA